MENNMTHHHIGRRDFLKIVGISTASASLAGCGKSGTVAENPALGPVPTDQMTHRICPSTQDKVSILGYGCMRWPLLPAPAANGNVIDQEMVNQLVDYALAHGVNYFDTAPVYLQGWSEESTGIALKRHPRDSYFIATKMSNQRLAGQGLSPQEMFEASVQMYHNSMEKLQTDYLDYYLLHNLGGGSGIPLFNERFIDNGLLDYLLKEREAGRIRNLGWSFHGDVKVFDHVLNLGVKWDFVQIQLNYLDWSHASGYNVNADYLYTELEKRGIPAVIMEPLLGGRLSNVPDHIVARLKQRRPDKSVASWAFRFAGSPKGVLTVLSGMTYMEHLQDNIRTFSPLEPITDDEREFLYDTADLMAQYPTIPCNDCKYCMPCPYALDIPAILLHYNKCVNEGHLPKSRQDENYREARQAFLVGYDRSVPKLRQASHCIGCNECVTHCPQRINIPKEMQRIDQFVEHLKQDTL
ncbi:MAG: aldo/keto reductase [Parabacteroides sp.]